MLNSFESVVTDGGVNVCTVGKPEEDKIFKYNEPISIIRQYLKQLHSYKSTSRHLAK